MAKMNCEVPINGPIKLFCDNRAAVSIANMPVQYAQTKHMEIDHILSEKGWRLNKSACHLFLQVTTEQIADIHTKELFKLPFKSIVSMLQLLDVYRPIIYVVT